MAAAMPMGLAKMRSHTEKTGRDMILSDVAFVEFANQGEEDHEVISAWSR